MTRKEWRDQLRGYYCVPRKVITVAWSRVVIGKIQRTGWFTVIQDESVLGE